MNKKYLRQLCEKPSNFGEKINLVYVNKCPKRFRTHDPRFASFILLPLTWRKTWEMKTMIYLIISLCHEPICGDTTDQHKVILSQQITMYWPKVKTFSVHTAYYLCKKKVLSFTVDLSFYGLIVFNSDCNAHSDWLQQWYHIKNVAYIRRLTSESF